MDYFNSSGWVAIFAGTETVIGRTRDVDGWDSNGVALVVDPEKGALRPVTDWPDFSHLEKANKVIATLPGGGWRARWDAESNDGEPLIEQVLAWLITSIGLAIPIAVSPGGRVEPASSADELLPPAINETQEPIDE